MGEGVSIPDPEESSDYVCIKGGDNFEEKEIKRNKKIKKCEE